MTGESDDAHPDDDIGSAPIDYDRLDIIADRFATDDRFTSTEDDATFTSNRVVCIYDSGLYPSTVQEARLEIVWFENGDFSLHYHEEYETETFDHRWDRHPSAHNSRDHIHPGPDALTPGDDTSHPQDWRDVLSMVLSESEERQRGFWAR